MSTCLTLIIKLLFEIENVYIVIRLFCYTTKYNILIFNNKDSTLSVMYWFNLQQYNGYTLNSRYYRNNKKKYTFSLNITYINCRDRPVVGIKNLILID